VLEGGDKVANRDMHYMVVDQDLDHSLEDPKASFTDKGKPRSINLVLFTILQLSLLCLCIYISGVELKP
jgi:hypothetical protein